MAKSKKPVRRGKNEGSLYQREDGLWIGVVSVGRDENGKRHRMYFSGKTKMEVQLKMNEATMARLKTTPNSKANQKIEELFPEWLFNFKKAEVSSRTFERCVGNAKLHIIPQLGGYKLSEVNYEMIQALLNKMLFKGYSLASVRKIKFLLNQFFDYMKHRKLIADNPVLECRVRATSEHKEQKREKYKAIPEDVREIFLEVIAKHPVLHAICMVQLLAGLRIGETLALKWKDVNFELGIINIDNAITQNVIMDVAGNVLRRDTIISDTKTAASVREVPITPTLKEVLMNYKKDRWALQRTTGISLIGPDDLVFGTNKGELRTYTGTRAMFRKLLKDNGLGDYNFHFHTLRHTFSTMLWEERENPKVIQMLLGHADVTTTIKTYNSVDRTYFAQATSKLEGKIVKK